MRIHFYIRFTTRFGQSLMISGNLTELGSGIEESAIKMEYLNDQFWHISISLSENQNPSVQHVNYHYILTEEGKESVVEWGRDRSVDLSQLKADDLTIFDTWNHAGEYENVFYTEPFREILIPQFASGIKPKPNHGNTHIFKVKAPLLRKNEVLCLLGSAKNMGAWASEKAVPMSREKDWWTVKLDLSREPFPLTYKYGIYQTRFKQFVEYEKGNNRFLLDKANKKKVTILHDGFAQLPNDTWRAAGVSIPVFSLKTKKSFGVGEFTDLIKLVDWAKSTGLRLIQVLPVNDTTTTGTWLDSYPYSAISAYALHPIYVNLEKIAGKEYASSIRSLKEKQKKLNELPDLDYEQVMHLKMNVLRDLYVLLKDNTFNTAEYHAFYKENEHWLLPYAAFVHLKDKYSTADFTKWKQHSTYDKASIKKLVSPDSKHHEGILLHYFIQFHLHLQLRSVHEYARKNGIVLKGDIPIGISRSGVDAWMSPYLFHMDMQAGAPPDDFAVKGQNWGFPTYKWSSMQKDGFEWWKKRFEQMALYFDAFRIDHILGFFRIWSIPVHAVEGIMGHFVPAIPVHINEFNQRGIGFDRYRFCKPYINDAVLWEMFGQDEIHFKPFLISYEDGTYSLKPEFSTQRQVEEYFEFKFVGDRNERMKKGLFDLISNVLLFEEESSEGTLYHFRFGMEHTSSFKHLLGPTQDRLKDLYIDYYFRRQDEYWKHEALRKLPALKRCTDMLICGEDLGLVPSCVADVMKQLGILSLEIQRMPKQATNDFFHPADAPYLSVVTPSTHDMSTIRGWWTENRNRTQLFYRQQLGKEGAAPMECEPWVNKEIILQHLYSPSMWAIFQLQDILGISESLRRDDIDSERINVPADPKHYWRYRMHIHLEDLLKETDFNAELKSYISLSGRTNKMN